MSSSKPDFTISMRRDSGEYIVEVTFPDLPGSNYLTRFSGTSASERALDHFRAMFEYNESEPIPKPRMKIVPE
jgi:hypothetical protein